MSNGSLPAVDQALERLLEATEIIKTLSQSDPKRLEKSLAEKESERKVRDAKLERYYTAIQTKMDKMVRQLDAVTQNQVKLTKALQAIMKSGKLTKEEEGDSSAASNTRKRPADEEAAPKSSSIDHQLLWARNMLLIGDGYWQALKDVDDLAMQILRLESDLNFRVLTRSEETLARLYDGNRGKLLFALPPHTDKVAISVGTKDLQDKDLMTLKEGSLEEVRRKNLLLLKPKVLSLTNMIKYLVSQRKMVLLLLPPYGMERIEIFKHWEDLVLKETAVIPSVFFKIINLPSVMRSTLPDFQTQEEYLKMWFVTENGGTKLSPYGCRRLFDLLPRAVTAKKFDPMFSDVSKDASQCLRCLRTHPGGSESCKSLDKVCRRCGIVGHFREVHDVDDVRKRREICKVLGTNIYGAEQEEEEEGPPSKTRKITEADVKAVERTSRTLDDWYAE